MASKSNDLTEVQNQKYLMKVEGEGDRLRRFLEIHPPEDASKTPPILAFNRKREVEIPWGDIVQDDTLAGAEAIQAIREYFEESWDEPVNEDNCKVLLSDGDDWRVKHVTKEQQPPLFHCLELDKPPKPGEAYAYKPLESGFVIRHGTSGRVYRLIESPGEALGEENFKSYDLYTSAWQHKIDGIELVVLAGDVAEVCADFEEIDLRPVVIQRKYAELRILRDFASKVKVNVAGVTDKMISQITATTLNVDELERLQRKVLRLEIGEHDVDRRIQRLTSDAARLGFLLFIEDKERTITYGDKKTTKLEPGKLYTTYRRTARWTQCDVKCDLVWVGWWIFRHPELKVTRTSVPKEQIVEDYQLVDTSKDILSEKRSAMLKEGCQVYVFEQTPSGLVTTEGVPLHQIMDRCKYDEAFRRACVVMLPVYEESLTGLRMVAKYSIFKRPLPGLVPTIMPRLSLEESLTYRTAWLETQLGELVSSINLAPDEERKVTIIKRFEQETAVTRTSTSIFDISRAETTDLATEMENQTRQEQESSKTMQFSTKASGGYGPFSAEASASGGTSSSLKDMSQAISKVARKAAKSVSSQNREEVSSTTTARTTVSNTDETVATIRNINQGRSLNLMFHRLYNKYEGGLFLEGLRFDVIPSVEVIAGSGVHESRSYSLEDLPRVVDEFKAAQLPFAIKDEEAYTNRLLESIETLLTREYATDTAAAAGANLRAVGAPAEPRAEETSVARLSLAPAGQPQVALKAPRGAARSKADSGLADLSERLRRAVVHTDDPIAPQELLVLAPGLYLDAVVGAQPSTEPYSERMREQTVALKMAEVALTQADARYREALAHHLVQNCGNWIVGVTPDGKHNTLIFTLKFPLAAGKWDFVLDGKTLCEVPADQLGNYTVNLRWDTHPKWMDDDGLMNHCLELHDREKGIVLRRV